MSSQSAPESNRIYATLLQLERLEALREEMDELGAASAAELAARPADPDLDDLLDDLRELGIEQTSELEARIAALHEQLDTFGG